MTTPTYRLGIDEARLLTEIPRLFQSTTEAVTEGLQNCYRAGASVVTVSYSQSAHRLILRDNGPGVADPDSVLLAGRSNWGPEVVDPAGLGLFALLGLSERITLTSRLSTRDGWSTTLTRDHWTGTPVSVETLPDLVLDAELAPHGFTVDAILNAEATPRRPFRQLLQEARHRYPIRVLFVDLDHPETGPVEVPAPPDPTLAIDTRVGRLAVRPDAPRHSAYYSLEIVWEHRVLSAHNAYHDLRNALHDLPDGDLVLKALPEQLIWFATPSAIHPRLPDRREPIEDHTYGTAIRQLAEDVVAAFDAETQRTHCRTLERPPVIRGSQSPDLAAPLLEHTALATVALAPFFRSGQPDVLLPLAGYRRCTWDDFAHIHVYEVGTIDSPETELDLPRFVLWVRDPLRVTNETMANLLCSIGQWAIADPDGEAVTLDVEGLALASMGPSDPPVGLARARAITAQRDDGTIVATFDHLLLGSNSDPVNPLLEDSGATLLFAGSAADGRRHLQDNPAVVGAAAAFLYAEGELWRYQDDDGDLEGDRLIHDLLQMYNRTWDPALYSRQEEDTARRAKRQSVSRLVEFIEQIQIDLSDMSATPPAIQDAAVALSTALEAALPHARTLADLLRGASES
jgi:hypothetical protein